MDDSAVVCSSCNRERKDFHNLKLMTYSFYGLWVLAVLYAVGAGSWNSVFLDKFEVERVFKTVDGWFAILAFIMGSVTYYRASKIAKTWWWY